MFEFEFNLQSSRVRTGKASNEIISDGGGIFEIDWIGSVGITDWGMVMHGRATKRHK